MKDNKPRKNYYIPKGKNYNPEVNKCFDCGNKVGFKDYFFSYKQCRKCYDEWNERLRELDNE